MKKTDMPNEQTGENRKALIYCRVSSVRQKIEGHGLDSQEHRCREYARANDMEVEEVFRDSFTGGGDFSKRPAMSEMFTYIDNKPHKRYAVIFDDISRLARDVSAHIKLRAAFTYRDVLPLCLNYNFDDSPEGEFTEVIMAANAELARKQNRRQVIQKQKARLEKGYWPFFPPPGYMQVRDPVHGKILGAVEPEASLIREAFEGFASDKFVTQADVVIFLREAGYNKGRKIYQEGVKRMLRRVVYAGYIERREWDVARRKGQHEGIVTLGVYERVQAKLDGKGKVRTRQSDRLDFILRGFLLCTFCQLPMTASWSRGRNKMFRYYRCKSPSCVRYNKSINADLIDEKFENLLRSVTPKPEAIQLAKAIALDLWQGKVKNMQSRQDRLEKGLGETQRQIEALSKRVIKTVDEGLVSIYEQQILRSRNEAELLKEKLKRLGTSATSFETALEVVFEFLENPLFIWENESVNAKRLVMRLVFADKLAFHPELGFETAQKSLLIGLFEQIVAKKSQDVEMEGIEPSCRKKHIYTSTWRRALDCFEQRSLRMHEIERRRTLFL